ncbi:MAG: TetR/AcrR family transcriptional regulator [Verrucomicrobiales bacterium]
MGTAETRKKLLDAAECLLLADGYTRTSIDAVCEKASMTKGSLYHHFKTKEDLAIATLERWLTRNGGILANGPHTSEADPVEAALLYIRHVADSTEKLWSGGCLVGSLSMDLAASSDRMQQCVEAMFKAFVEQHAELFAPLVADSPCSNTPTPEELAEMFLSVIEGAIVIGKSYRDPMPLVRSIRSFCCFAEQLSGRSTPSPAEA